MVVTCRHHTRERCTLEVGEGSKHRTTLSLHLLCCPTWLAGTIAVCQHGVLRVIEVRLGQQCVSGSIKRVCLLPPQCFDLHQQSLLRTLPMHT